MNQTRQHVGDFFFFGKYINQLEKNQSIKTGEGGSFLLTIGIEGIGEVAMKMQLE